MKATEIKKLLAEYINFGSCHTTKAQQEKFSRDFQRKIYEVAEKCNIDSSDLYNEVYDIIFKIDTGILKCIAL